MNSLRSIGVWQFIVVLVFRHMHFRLLETVKN